MTFRVCGCKNRTDEATSTLSALLGWSGQRLATRSHYIAIEIRINVGSENDAEAMFPLRSPWEERSDLLSKRR